MLDDPMKNAPNETGDVKSRLESESPILTVVPQIVKTPVMPSSKTEPSTTEPSTIVSLPTASSMGRSPEDPSPSASRPQDHSVRRTSISAIIVSFIMYALMVILASVPALILTMIIGAAIHGSIGFTLTASGVGIADWAMRLLIILSLVFTPLMASLALAPRTVRRAIRSNGGLGVDVHGLEDRLRIPEASHHRAALAWLKAMGVGILTASLVFGALQLMGAASRYLTGFAPSSNDATQSVIDLVKTSSLWMSVLVVALAGIVIPVMEELVFRGVIARSWAAMSSTSAGRRWSYVGSGMLFALIHMLSTGFAGAATVMTILITWIMGAILSWFVDRWKTLWPGIFTHVIYNTAGILLALI